jgi:beta-glucanase (GH16 family)
VLTKSEITHRGIAPKARRERATARAHRRRWWLLLGVLGAVVAGAVSLAAAAPEKRLHRAPKLVVPSGFAPVARYHRLVANYVFSGSRLPAAWTRGTHNYGFHATLYRRSQVRMTGSSVALTAVPAPAGAGFPYRSGWISTAGHFTLTHGLIDFRASMPAGQGLWSGLWAVNAQRPGRPQTEIDVQEMLLGDTHRVYGSLHVWEPQPLWGETQTTALAADASQGFHDFQLVWQHGMITWAVDGRVYAQYTEAQARAAGRVWPFDTARGVYLIANLAVAAADEVQGPPNASTTFPSAMHIRSVRVWQ